MNETSQESRPLRPSISPADPTAPAARPLKILRVNPLEHEAALKSLMTSHGVTTFARFFDEGYPGAVRDGATSWVGVDERGDVQMNVTLFIHRFDVHGRRAVGGMLGNMMVATEHRTFFPAVELLRQVIRDAKKLGNLDFVYGDPGPKGAQAIFRGARMRLVGSLDRFVIPLRDERWHRSVLATAYSASLGLRHLRGAARVRIAPARTSDAAALAQPLDRADGLHPLHSIDMYERRLPGWPGRDDYVAELRFGGDESPPSALALLRGPEEWGVVSVHVLRRRVDVRVSACVPGLIRVARRLGGTRLQVEAVEGSRFARELVAGGFAPRADHVPIYAAAFTPLGDAVLDAVDGWELTGVDMER